jgi:ABC-type sugar transport system ATPase subunit
MTVFDNIAFPLKMRKMPKTEMTSEVKKAAELLKIEHLLQRKPIERRRGTKSHARKSNSQETSGLPHG